MTSIPSLDHLPPEHLRALAMQLIQRVETMHKKINRDQAVIENRDPRGRATQALDVRLVVF